MTNWLVLSFFMFILMRWFTIMVVIGMMIVLMVVGCTNIETKVVFKMDWLFAMMECFLMVMS